MAVTVQFKDTWWNKLRVERNITYKELGQYFDVAYSTVGSWFSGQVLPDRYYIQSICDLFDVDYFEGEQHFIEDNAKWKSERKHGKYIQSTGKQEESTIQSRLRSRTTCEHKTKTEPKEKKVEVIAVDVFKIVYGKISYELFLKFTDLLASGEGDPMEIIYGKVTYAEYKQIEAIIQEGEHV